MSVCSQEETFKLTARAAQLLTKSSRLRQEKVVPTVGLGGPLVPGPGHHGTASYAVVGPPTSRPSVNVVERPGVASFGEKLTHNTILMYGSAFAT